MNKYSQYIKLNKNILIAFAASIAISAIIAQILAEQENYLNTTLTLLVDYLVYFSVFSFLFYLDNKNKYKLNDNSDRKRLKHDLVKLVSSLGIGEIVYTISRGLLHYHFLELGYEAYIASLISQCISTVVYLFVVNLSVKVMRLYKNES